MTLGEHITALRTARGLSQSELAERLQVSRQSVSKWETDASVPELDKLLLLAQTFDVTLDQLVKGDPAAPDTSCQAAPAPVASRQPPRVMIGSLLLLFGASMALIFSLRGNPPTVSLAIVFPFLSCGVLCLLVKDLLPLWCVWGVFLFAFLWDYMFPWNGYTPPVVSLTPLVLLPVTAWFLRGRLWGSPHRRVLACAWPVGAVVNFVLWDIATDLISILNLWLSHNENERRQRLGEAILRLSTLLSYALIVTALAALFYYIPKLLRKKRA